MGFGTMKSVPFFLQIYYTFLNVFKSNSGYDRLSSQIKKCGQALSKVSEKSDVNFLCFEEMLVRRSVALACRINGCSDSAFLNSPNIVSLNGNVSRKDERAFNNCMMLFRSNPHFVLRQCQK